MENDLKIEEYFFERTGHKLNDYIAEHMTKMITKYGWDLFQESLEITLDRNDIKTFEMPADFIKYQYAVCKNKHNSSRWE